MENGDLWIGAGTAFSHITNDPLIQKYIPMLGDAVDMVGGPRDPQHRNHRRQYLQRRYLRRFCLYHVDAEAEVLLEGPSGKRAVPVCEFYTGPGRTVRDRCEVCTGFLVKKKTLKAGPDIM